MRGAPASTSSRQSSVRYHFVGGKGGVGKTTCAAALAARSARTGRRTLVVTTDPAPSLGDVFRMRAGARPRRVPLAGGRLEAVEIDAAAVIRTWVSSRAKGLRDIALRGTWLDEQDVDALLGLSFPGLDELAGLLEIDRYGRSGRYDAIVVDTAPTGHTLRMLAMPETLTRMSAVFDAMQDKHRAIVGALRGRWVPDAADALVHEMAGVAAAFETRLRDETMTELSWVTLPERMAIEETLDAIVELHAAGMRVQRVIVNRMTPAGRAGCRYCSVRRKLESAAAADLVSRLRACEAHAAVATVADRSSEPVGPAALSRLAAEIARAVPPPARMRTLPKAQRTVKREAGRFVRLDMTDGASIVFFAGKGGVGKTTCAAASAIHAADQTPGRQVLLLSTDPAHSLGDVFGAPVGDRAVRVPGAPANLQARELDARAALDRARREYASSIDALFDRIAGGSGFDASHDRRVMHGLLDLAPPGLDELAAVVEVTSALRSEADQDRWDLLVVDTAPTGHALRLLQMPELLHEWTRTLMRIVLKYQPVTGVGALGEQLLILAKRIAALRAALIDPSVTSFVVVTRAATLPVRETARLLTALKRLSIRPRALIINATGGGTCAACLAARRMERRALRSLTQLAGKRLPDDIVHAPAAMPPPAGIAGLRAWRSGWAEPPK